MITLNSSIMLNGVPYSYIRHHKRAQLYNLQHQHAGLSTMMPAIHVRPLFIYHNSIKRMLLLNIYMNNHILSLPVYM